MILAFTNFKIFQNIVNTMEIYKQIKEVDEMVSSVVSYDMMCFSLLVNCLCMALSLCTC